MPAFIDITGQTFNRLTALYRISGPGNYWLCRCTCGVEKKVGKGHLCGGKTKSCGCLREESTRQRFSTHGLARIPEYAIWITMRDRILNSHNHDFADYGGRGITVCKRWQKSFLAFYKDMGPRPSPEHTLERKRNNGSYSPKNCRWATRKEQGQNKRNNVRLRFQGRTRSILEWSKITKISCSVLRGRAQRDWPVEKILMQPVRHSSPRKSNL